VWGVVDGLEIGVVVVGGGVVWCCVGGVMVGEGGMGLVGWGSMGGAGTVLCNPKILILTLA